MSRRPLRAQILTALTALAIAAALLPAPFAQGKAAAAAKLPPFFYSDNPSVAKYKAGSEAELKKARASLDKLVAVKGKRKVTNTLVPYNEMIAYAENAANQANLMESVHPDSVFRRTLTIQRTARTERVVLRNDVITKYRDGRAIDAPLERGHLQAAARELFGITLPDGPFVFDSYAAATG